MDKNQCFKRVISLVLVIFLVANQFSGVAHAVDFTDDAAQQTGQSTQEGTPDDLPVILPDLDEEELIGDIIITEDGFRIQMNGDEASYTVLEYIGVSKQVQVPSQYDGLPVTRIADAAFYGNVHVQSIAIPDSIVFVGEHAFYGCSALEYNVSAQGNYLGNAENPYYYFAGVVDSAVTEITVHKDTKIVGAFAFADCSNLKKVVIGDNVVSMGYAALGKDSNIESLQIPFVGMDGKGQRNYHLGYIFGARTVAGNISYIPLTLNELVITGGNGDTKIAHNSFYGVDMVESLTLPFLGNSIDDTTNNYLSYIYGGTDYQDNIVPQTLKNVTILGGDIGSGAFYNCSHICTVVLKDNAKIGGKAFSGCTSLASIDISDAVTSVGSDAFLNCTSLNSVNIHDITAWAKISFAGSTANPLCYAENLYLNHALVTDLVIPAEVVKIGSYAFSGYKSLKSVTIEEGVTDIGNNTFSNCTQLTDVDLPESLTVIGGSVFQNCTSLESIALPSGVTAIESSAFRSCTGLTEIDLPEGLTTIGTYAFGYCSGLTSVDMPKSVTSIGENAFYGCTSLRSITIPENVTTLGQRAFASCTGLQEINYNAVALSTMGYNVFLDAGRDSSEMNLTIDAAVTAVPTDLFYGTNIKTVIFEDGSVCKSIGAYAFENCKKLTTVILPDSLEVIKSGAFSGCESLVYNTYGNGCYLGSKNNPYYALIKAESTEITECTIHEDTVLIVGEAFSGCKWLETINFNAKAVKDPGDYSSGFQNAGTSGAGVTLNIGSNVTRVPAYLMDGVTALVTVVFAENSQCVEIGNSAFQGCSGIKNISLPASVIRIGNFAFNACTGLTGITLPTGLTSIGYNAFASCTGLTSIVLPESLTTIGGGAFSNCTGITSITIPKNVTYIGWNAFSGCTGLTEIVLNATLEDFESGQSAFANIGTSGVGISVTIGAQVTRLPAYIFQNCTNISSIIFESNSQCTSIGMSACYGLTALKSIEIPANVKKIGYDAFYNCTGLESIQFNAIAADDLGATMNLVFYNAGKNGSGITVTIGKDVTKIPAYLFCPSVESFNHTPNITTLVFEAESSCTSIGDYAFYNCEYLTNVVLPDSITYIGKSAFAWCSGVTQLQLPAALVTIDDEAFYGCMALTSLVLPEGLLEIGDYAFTQCSALKQVELPESLTSIGYGAFQSCYKLTQASYPGTQADFTAAVTVEEGNELLLNVLVFGDGTTTASTAAHKQEATQETKTKSTVVTTAARVNTPAKAAENNPKATSTGAEVNAVSEGLTFSSNGDGTCTVTGRGTNKDTALVIPSVSPDGDVVTAIAANAFKSKTSITSVVIPDTVTSIGAYAFAWCDGLVSITIGKGVKTMGNYAFYNCKKLENVYFNATAMDDLASRNFVFDYCGGSGAGIVFTIGSNVTRIPARLCDPQGNGLSTLKSVVFEAGSVCTVIGAGAFSYCKNLTNIDIPDSIEEIGTYVFSGCSKLSYNTYDNGKYLGNAENPYVVMMGVTSTSITSCEIHPDTKILYSTGTTTGVFTNCKSLTSITIPANVKSIGSYTFYNCTALKSVTIHAKLTTIPAYAFYQCSALTTLELPDTLTEIGNYAFNKSGLKTVQIPATVTRIGSYAFASTALTQLEIPASVQTIGAYAFSSISYLEKVTFADGVLIETLGENAFKNCLYLKEIIFGENSIIKIIGAHAFDNCCRVVNLTLPEGLVEIGDYAFYYCTALVNLTLPESLAQIGAYAFSKCTSLVNVTLPNGIYHIAGNVFANCSALTEIIYDGAPTEWRHVRKASDWDNGAGDYTLTCLREDTGLLYDANEDITEFWISGYSGSGYAVAPGKFSGRLVTAIYEKAFDNNKDLVSLELPDTVVVIGEYAFRNCSNLVNINLPVSLQQVSKGIFVGCSSLQDLELPFLGETRDQESGAYLGYYFGADSYHENEAYIPKALLHVTVLEAEEIADHCFSGCKNLESVILPEGVTNIGAYAFSGCSSLKTFRIPDSTLSVEEMVFDNCTGLKTIEIGASLQSIGDYTAGNPLFGLDKSRSQLEQYIVSENNENYQTDAYGVLYKMHVGLDEPVAVMDAPAMANLKGYAIPELIVEIAPYAFAYNSTLTAIDLAYVRRIANNAFFEADGLIYVTLSPIPENGADPDRLAMLDQITYSQYIGNEAFMGCDSLKAIDINSDHIVGIGDFAFADCPMLVTVTLGKRIEVIGLSAFGTTASGESNLEWFYVADENVHFQSIDGVLFSVNDDDSLTLEICPSRLLADNTASKKEYLTEYVLPEDQNITAIQTYAFQSVKELKKLVIDPADSLIVGDYAFAYSKIREITIGKNVTSLGLIRGGSEYTAFSDMEYLTHIEVADDNAYYSDDGGVLYDKSQRKLIKYPAAKTGSEYETPSTLRSIASMAFKGNEDLVYVTITSEVATIGLEAFYACSGLLQITFKNVYAPTAILENAFSTSTQLENGSVVDPRTQIGYFSDYYEDGTNGEYGWKNYEGIYNLVECQTVPELDVREDSANFYAVVVVDSNGNRLGNMLITLTDPYGTSETVISGTTSGAAGAAMFYDLRGTEGVGFALDFDNPYTITVSDLSGKYYTFTNTSFYLDQDMLITYITMTSLPSVYGLNCGEEDMNSQRVELNKSACEFTDFLFDEQGNIVVAEDGVTPLFEEVIEISAIGYCDTGSGYAFVDADGNVLDESCGLYQNGVKVASVDRTELRDGAVVFYFRPYVADLANEVDIEVRLTAVHAANESQSCSTVLNIHVFDFYIDKNDISLDDAGLSLDLGSAGDLFTLLFGDDEFDISLGEHLKFISSIEGDVITFALEGTKELDEKNKKIDYDCERGFKANIGGGNSAYHFRYQLLFIDETGHTNWLTYNVALTKATESDGYYYYRCRVLDGLKDTGSNLLTSFYGVVNKELFGLGKSDRHDAKTKADLIVFYHFGYVASNCEDLFDVKESGGKACYSEPVIVKPHKTTTQKVEVSVRGSVSFKYLADEGIQIVGGAIKGNVALSFKHSQQMAVWVIPVVLDVSVKGNGSIEAKITVDENRDIDWEVLYSLDVDLTASIGVGCTAVSMGLYGNVGTVFILEICPDFGVKSWKVYGEMGYYVKFFWYTLKENLTPDAWKDGYYIVGPEKEAQLSVMSEETYLATMFLADSYTSTSADSMVDMYELVVINDELYKLCYADVTGKENYDEYNYVKFALSKWNGSAWTEPIIIDDNGFNDGAYTLYYEGDKVMLAYTQQTKKLTTENLDDTYAAASDLAIKVVELSGDSFDPVTVHVQSEYAYLTQYAVIDGIPTMVWAENADNNIFGVSPHNYIDSNGESHVFATDANSIWMSQLKDGVWTQPVQLCDNLSAVTQLVINDSGYIAYIIDTDGDLSNTEDRVLYYGALDGTISALNNISKGSIDAVIAEDNGFLYHYDCTQEEAEDSDGWYSITTNAGAANQTLPEGMPEVFELLYDENGAMRAVLYSSNKTWMEAGNKMVGSAIYGIFCEDGVWGEPIEIEAYRPQNDRYVSEFAAALVGNEIRILGTTMNSKGEHTGDFDCSYTCKKSLAAAIHTIDYPQRRVAFTVNNTGSNKSSVYVSVNGGAYNLVTEEPLISGGNMQYTVTLSGSPEAVHSVSFATDANGADSVTVEGISLAYSDLQPLVKQLLLGEDDVLLLAVKNTGNISNGAISIIRADAEKKSTEVTDSLYEAVMALELTEGKMIEFTFMNENGEQETAWAVLDYLQPGDIVYHELVLSEEVVTEDGSLFGVLTIAAEDTEPDNAAENNYTSLNYDACMGVLQEGETVDTVPALDSSYVTFDPKADESICIGFSGAEDAALSKILIDGQAISAAHYSIQKTLMGGRITIVSDALSSLTGGVHTVTVQFASGESCELQLKVISYYTVKWLNGGAVLREDTVREGEQPNYDGKLFKTPTVQFVYEFAGWDADGDGTVDHIRTATEDIVYTAVWTAKVRTYTVSWVMLDASGEEHRVVETYAYNAMPNYGGVVMAPQGQAFLRWDQTVTKVTADAVYTAVYGKNASVISSEFVTAPGLEFNVTVSYADVINLTKSEVTIFYDTQIVSLISYQVADHVLVTASGEGYITLSVNDLNEMASTELITFCFKVQSSLPAGEHDYLNIESKDALNDMMGGITVYQNGDINQDGILNTKDLVMLKQYILDLRELSEIQLAYCNVFADYNEDGSAKINSKDVVRLKQIILGIAE